MQPARRSSEVDIRHPEGIPWILYEAGFGRDAGPVARL